MKVPSIAHLKRQVGGAGRFSLHEGAVFCLVQCLLHLGHGLADGILGTVPPAPCCCA